MENCVCVRVGLHPFPGLVLQERLDDGVHGVDVPGLVHKVDPPEPGRETVLGGEVQRSVLQNQGVLTPFIYNMIKQQQQHRRLARV